jgi:type IV pilus assembly protein PilY1
MAAPPLTTTSIYPAVPPNTTSSASKPMMMLVSSKDHTLFSPIFSDFEDLDGDGVIDTTFKPSFKYYGYFDATKCYLYNSSGRFEPSRLATLSGTAATPSGSTTPGRYVCGVGNEWSGNFLNWTSMTRLDVMRKILYGGQRFLDSNTDTVLQIARLSQDSHSFVKYYRGTDIRDYTPFSTQSLTKTTGQNANTYAGLSMCVRSSADDDGRTSAPTMRMARGNYKLWATVNGTVCNWGNAFSAKLARYYGNGAAYFGNGGINHESAAINQTSDGASYSGLGPDLQLRVQVCKAGLLGDERCQAYGTSGTLFKPIGLLQDFGTPQAGTGSARTEFGLLSGSYDKNLTAGALRKNIGDMLDEINPNTGQFCFSSGASCPGTALADGRAYTASGAIRALDNIILFGRTGGQYSGSGNQLPSEMANGTLPAWGNPVGEMVTQAIRYFTGTSSTNPGSTGNDTSIGMPVATWADPLTSNSVRTAQYGKAICRPMNILAFSSSALSFDGDDVDSQAAGFINLSRGTLSAFTDAVGKAEGINGTSRAVGSVNAAAPFGETCAAKTIVGLGSVSGVCPEAPAIGGSYKVAGAALYANTNDIRKPAAIPSDLPAWGLKVKTYAASLSGGVARIDIPVPNSNPTQYVSITPEGLWSSPNKKMPSAMLTFNAISASATHGAFTVTWNDTLFGGDYDMDITGYLRYDILPAIGGGAPRLKVSTDILGVGAGYTGAHGFSIIGTKSKDGRYFTHRHNANDSVLASTDGYLCGYSAYINSSNLSGVSLPTTGVFPGIAAGSLSGNGNWACKSSTDSMNVRTEDAPVSITFEMQGAANALLREPLWYAAKYGAFAANNSKDNTELPDTTTKWDNRRNDGKTCGGSTGLACADGEPDGYFLARRPELLEQRLRETLESIVANSNAAPAVSSRSINDGSLKYVASFDPAQNTGAIEAFVADSKGEFSKAASWNSGNKLNQISPLNRAIITNDGTKGVAFRTNSTLSSDYLSALLGTGTPSITTAQRDELINYLRGERSKEKPAGIWRKRTDSNIMGPIVNSTPWVQTRPSAQYLGALPSGAPSYTSFIKAQANRDRLIWVGANDGMLHGFKAQGSDAGAPVLSYVPSPLVARLKTIAQDSSQTIPAVDGSPFTGDVLIGNNSSASWKTYLFNSLGRGGRAFFALDVTNPATLTEANASSIFKWMFSASDDADLGYTLADVKLHLDRNQATPIVRMNNGKFAILLPNGPGSTDGKAALFVLFIDGPDSTGKWVANTHYVKIPTDSLGDNGLMGVNWVDSNRDGTADTVYATDLQGRIWKFDVSSTTPSSWQSAYTSTTSAATPLPLFEAKEGNTRLPISTTPVLAFPPYKGTLVIVGTGKSITSTDFPNSSTPQRLYAVYDNNQRSNSVVPVNDLNKFAPRVLTRDATTGGTYISTGNKTFNPATDEGWYLNFATLSSTSTLSNEMVISSPELNGGQIFATATRPAGNDATKCYNEPLNTGYVLDPYTGTPQAGMLGTITLSNGKKVNLIGIDSKNQKNFIASYGNSTKIVGPKDDDKTLPPVKGAKSRNQWREITGMRSTQ